MTGKIILVLILLIVMFFSLQYALWGGRQNAIDLLQLRTQLSSITQENQEFGQRNNRLHADIIDIKNRLGAIESQARYELGLIKQGETYYQIIRPEADISP